MVGRGQSRRCAPAPLLLLACLACSCGVFTYHSPFPHQARNPQVEVEVDDIVVSRNVHPQLDRDRGVMVVAEVWERPGASVGAPSLGPSSGPPCSGGVVARSDSVYSRVVQGSTKQTLVLAFSGPAVASVELFGKNDAVLDLPVFPADRAAPAGCLRVPLQTLSQGTEWRATPYMFGLELRFFSFARPLPNYGSFGLLIALSQGFWLDGWRLSAGFQGGLIEERGVAPSSGTSSGKLGVGILGGAFEAGHLLWTRGHLGLDAQFGYDVLATVAPDAARSPAEAAAYRRSILHGPRLSIRLLGLPTLPGWRGFAAPQDGYSFGLAAFAGAWWQGGDSVTPAPVFGLSLDGNIGL